MLASIGVSQNTDPNCEGISYEAPFGVGYLVAQLVGSTSQTAEAEPRAAVTPSWSSSDAASPQRVIPALARLTIETFVSSGNVIHPPDNLPDELNVRAGCFVSIKTREGELRGCIGTIEPLKNTLAQEIIANAVNAATRDPRFLPVQVDELPNLKYSVDVLSAPEATTLENLDPKIYGVIVEDESGLRRGLLLPNLAGVDTVGRQVEIASGKAGISHDDEIRLFRFQAERYLE